MNIDQTKILITKVLEESGFNLYELKWEKDGADDYLRVFIDKETGRVTLDEIVEMSEKISLALDESALLNDAYILDVSSAGAEKKVPLDKLEKALNSYIKVALHQPYKTYDTLEGTLLDVDQDKIVLQVNFKGRIAKVTLERNNLSKVNYAIKF